MEGSEVLQQSTKRKGRLTRVLAFAILVSTFGSSFQYGYNVAVINSPATYMQQFYNQSYFDRYGTYMDNSFQTVLWSLTVSMYPLGGFFGSLMVAPLVNTLGRKGTLLFNNIFSIVPAILMGTSKAAKSFEIIIFARIMIGICAGLSSNVVPMYLGELSPKNLRGAIGVMPQLFITIGILIAQIFGIRSILANEKGWPLLLSLTGFPAVVELILLPFFPESPRFMLIQKGNLTGARAALRRIRGWDDVDDEIEEMRMEDQSEKAEGHMSVLNLFSFRSLRWQLVSIIILNMGQQLSGVNADNVDGMPYLSIACIIIYVIGHAIGPSPIPYVITTEMFRQSSRPAAFMVAGSVHWLSNFIVGLIFPFLEKGLGEYSFIIFGGICLATFAYIFIIIPETKSKTFLEISQMFAKRNKVEIKLESEHLELHETNTDEHKEVKSTAM
ncbi:solute carrier family 2, facilitated glucose transporter member 1a isoform X3 [Chiloscyllium plagiosum]|uniref:solute carrier family 2, facilitated glucose transporter member 1a isoform X3 n=1 Tax=Chiloscyllium plagiosum TaxID=36176 RepID=UPI001CB885E0|nr:solute carrier family 2, facilitated glucose transporter member 1a isoform X3 [Chiloscyllium plagiosum]